MRDVLSRFARRARSMEIPSMNRLMFIGMTFAGIVLVLRSTRRSWFDVPTSPFGGSHSAADIVSLAPSCTTFFQALMFIGLIVLASSWLWRRRWTWTSNALACLMLVVALAFPYAVMIRSPVQSAEAAWLQMQHDNLIWLGGDINTSAELGRAAWKSKVYVVDVPRQIKVVQLPSWSPWEIGLDRGYDLLGWLGYSNAYCQFVRKGWSSAVFGWAMLLLATLMHRGVMQMNRAGFSLALLTAMFLSAALVGWLLPFRAAKQIQMAARATGAGDHQAALGHMERACDALPALRQDTYYVAQRGLSEHRLGIASEYAELFVATDRERAGQFDVAFDAYEQLAESTDPAIRREALRAVLRYAIQDYNSGQMRLARRRLDTVLRDQPCNLKVIYILQLVHLRQNRADQVYAMCDWMYEATDHLRFSTKKILRASSQRHAAMAAALDDDALETWLRSSKAKSP